MAQIAALPPAVITGSYRTVPIGFGRVLGVLDAETLAAIGALGAYDCFAFNAIDPSGRSCAIGLGVERSALTEEEVMLCMRLNSHLASAYRCRRRLLEVQKNPLDEWEALFNPDGRLLDARGPAKDEAERTALNLAAKRLEAVRRRRSEDEPTMRWTPRVRGRWTFVDAFASGGERYIVARENQTAAPGLEVLTERERQVAASAALGKTSKQIAYELGISHPTVRVLLSRARGRLGVQSDEEFRALPAIKALRGS